MKAQDAQAKVVHNGFFPQQIPFSVDSTDTPGLEKARISRPPPSGVQE